jgi:hypothetical protein
MGDEASGQPVAVSRWVQNSATMIDAGLAEVYEVDLLARVG